MSREAAKIVLDAVLRHAAEQDTALIEIQAKCSPEEFKRYKQMIGKSMGAIFLEIVHPIVAQYPDLKPPQMK
ncbi:MAG TPA: hypothetical protein VFB45_10600 [Pseudolabrys sp.]|nr:hypothetical protein [Pseudolabrys sp.]